MSGIIELIKAIGLLTPPIVKLVYDLKGGQVEVTTADGKQEVIRLLDLGDQIWEETQGRILQWMKDHPQSASPADTQG